MMRAVQLMAGLVLLMVGAGAALAQEARPQSVEMPAEATALEGTPTVRIDSVEGSTTRRVLGESEAATQPLAIRIVDGEFYWTSRDNRRLRLSTAGEFTYLSSEPGKYVRFTRLHDRISYVEHVDTELGSVTWWGELRIVVRN
jgi:hypothetical protein